MLSRPPRTVRRSNAHSCDHQTREIEQVALAGVQQRQEVAIDVAFRLRGRLVGDAVLKKPLPRPFAGVSVTADG
jgi:hypothetical protein